MTADSLAALQDTARLALGLVLFAAVVVFYGWLAYRLYQTPIAADAADPDIDDLPAWHCYFCRRFTTRDALEPYRLSCGDLVYRCAGGDCRQKDVA